MRNKRTKAFDELVEMVEGAPPGGLGLEVADALARAIQKDPATLRWYLEMRFGKPKHRLDVGGLPEVIKVIVGGDPREDL